jgi:hypothetical protein
VSGAIALVCPRHPDREGVGICIACKRVVCGDCATRLEGINHCRECLERKLRESTTSTASPSWRWIEGGFAACAVGGTFLMLFFGYVSLGYLASDVDWFGSGLSDTARALDDATDGLRRFNDDVGRFPSGREGLRALLVDDPISGDPPIDRWRGPYVRSRKGGPTDEALLKDGYGSRLHYVSSAQRRRPAVLSIGANRELETDTSALALGDSASGDDSIRWVR